MSATLRTFAAVELNDEIRHGIARLIRPLADAYRDVRWVSADNIHLTLKFLGEVDSRQIPEVCDAASRAVAGILPFSVEAAGLGAFPSLDRPRTLWVGIRQAGESLTELHDRLDEELGGLGFGRERRKFTPHLTIGRLRQGRRGSPQLTAELERKADFTAGQMHVDELVTFSSELTREGPIYTPLGRATLG